MHKKNFYIPPLPKPRLAEINPALLPSTHLAKVREIAEANLASEHYAGLVKEIANFDASLDEKHEVGVRLVNFGQTFIFHLEGMDYLNPSLIVFYGATDKGDPIKLIQHVTQINILLMKLPRREPDKPKQPLGFAVEDEND